MSNPQIYRKPIDWGGTELHRNYLMNRLRKKESERMQEAA